MIIWFINFILNLRSYVSSNAHLQFPWIWFSPTSKFAKFALKIDELTIFYATHFHLIFIDNLVFPKCV